MRCSESAACRASFPGSSAVCAPSTCNAEVAACDVECASDAACAAHGEAYTCSSGRCRRSASAPDGTAADSGSAASGCVPLPAGVVGWWPFDGDATDLIGDAHGMLVGGARADAEGVVGRALTLDGSDDYVEIPARSELNFGTGDYSIAFWFRAAPSDVVTAVLDKRSNPEGERFFGYHVYVWESRVGTQLAGGAYHNYDSGNTVAPVEDREWHHVVLTVERNNGTGLRFYVDGVAGSGQNATLVPPDASVDNDSPLFVGRRAVEASGYSHGSIDELLLVRGLLSPEQVSAMFRAGAAGVCKP